jgi:hypothetical protein
MSGLIGALAGLAVAVVDIVALRALSRRVDLPETRQVLAVTGWTQLVLLPAAGWAAGHYLFGE